MENGPHQGGGSGGSGEDNDNSSEHVAVEVTSEETASSNHGRPTNDQSGETSNSFIDDLIEFDLKKFKETMSEPIKKRIVRQSRKQCPSPSKRSKIAPVLPPLPASSSSSLEAGASTSSNVVSPSRTGGTTQKAGVASSSLAGGGVGGDLASIPIAARVFCPPPPLVSVSIRPAAPRTYSPRSRLLLPARLPSPVLAPGTTISQICRPAGTDKNKILPNSISNGMSTSLGLPKTVSSTVTVTPTEVVRPVSAVSLPSNPLPVNHVIRQSPSENQTVTTEAETLPVVVKPAASTPLSQPYRPSQLHQNVFSENPVPAPTSSCRATPTNLNRLSASRPEITIIPITTTVTATSTFLTTRWNDPKVTQDVGNDTPSSQIPNTTLVSQHQVNPTPSVVTVSLPSGSENTTTASSWTQTMLTVTEASTQTDPETVGPRERRFRDLDPAQRSLKAPQWEIGVVRKFFDPQPSSQITRNDQINPNLETNDTVRWPALESGTVEGSPGAISSQFPMGADAPILSEEGNWRSKLTTGERFKYSLNKHDSHDVMFKIGSGDAAEKIHCHRLVLIVSCDLLKNNIVGGRHSSNTTFEFPDLDPDAFRTMLDFIYLGKFDNNDMGKISEVIKVAEKVGCQDLIVECTSLLRKTISPDNAVELYHLSLMNKDETLRRYTLSYIISNPRSVLFSKGFLKASKQALNDVLSCDDWYLHELAVFEAVKRWAEANTLQNLETMKMAKGAQLRATLGDVLYSIRFLSVPYVDLATTINVCNPGLFENDEILAFVKHLSDKGSSPPPPPARFNVRPRRKRNSSPGPSSTTNEYGIPDAEAIEKTGFISSDASDDHLQKSSSEVNIIEDSNEIPIPSQFSPRPSTVEHLEPPKKKRKVTRRPSKTNNINPPKSSVTVSSAPDVNTLLAKDLSSYAKYISKNEDNFKSVTVIKEMLKISIPTVRVYMPNLKELLLDLYLTKPKQHGSSLKSFLKKQFSSLWDILFVNVNIRSSEQASSGSENSVNILSQLLDHKVNISITCADVKMFCINHDDGMLLMNLIKDAQQIINVCRNFPLKILALGDCDITSLDPLRRDLLEVIVMRRVKGLKMHSNFLVGCTKLREVSWNDLGSEEINLTQHVLDKNSKSLNKLALAKCTLTLPLCISIGEQKNTLKELYLDNCNYEPNLVSSLPSLFPFVSRVQIYGTKCDAILLHSILDMKSIKFIFVWELAYLYIPCPHNKKKTSTVPCPKSKMVQTFLGRVFDESYAKNEKNTFILQRKNCDAVESSSHCSPTYNNFNSLYWKGTKLIKNKYEEVNKQDYEHYSYSTFFPTYETFRFFDSTEKDAKKKKGVQNVSGPDLMSSDSNTSNANADSTDTL